MFMALKPVLWLSPGEAGRVEKGGQFCRTGKCHPQGRPHGVCGFGWSLPVFQEHHLRVLNMAVVHQLVTKPLCAQESLSA